MSLEKKRHILITLYFMEQERTVTFWELSQMTHVSSRTIKGDIAQINQELKKQGGEIVSKKSEGYFLRVENEEALRRYKEKLELISYYRSPLYEFQDFLRLSVILRKLLLTGETHPAKLEELAESLFVSRSAFRRDMKKCSRFLGSYSLNLHSKPGQGTYVEGQERDVRMAMLAIYGFSLKELGMDYVEEPFFEQFSGEDFHEAPITFNLYERHHAAFWKENWQKKPFSVEDQMAADPLYYLTNEVYAPLDAEIALVGTHCGFVDEELFHFSSYYNIFMVNTPYSQ